MSARVYRVLWVMTTMLATYRPLQLQVAPHQGQLPLIKAKD